MVSELSTQNVVRIPGKVAAPSSRIVPADVVAMLEDCLDRARNGDIAAIALAIVTNNADGFDAKAEWSPGTAPANMMLCAVCGLEASVKAAWLDMHNG